MKILQINSFCGCGSTGRIATDIYKILEEQGHDCVIAYGRGVAPDRIKTIKIGTRFDNYAHVAKSRFLDKHGFGSIKATKKLIKSIKEYNPDIIHLHNIHGYYINIELLFNYLRELNKPIIWTLHDCWAFTGHCAYFDYVGCDKWKVDCNNCAQKKEYPSSIIIDNSKWNYEKKKEIFTSIKNMTIVTPSKWLADLVNQSFLGSYPIKVINNGVDLDLFQPTESKFRQKYNLNNNFVILGVASIWDRRKGYNYFENLSRKLNSNQIIVLVGLTDKQRRQLPKNIIGIKRTNNINELVEIYSMSDVFVNPTLEDNFPTTNIEALACGLPVITFNTGGSIESVEKNTGYIVEKNNLDEILKKLKQIENEGKLHYSEYCKKRAVELYNKKDRFNEYVELYKKLY